MDARDPMRAGWAVVAVAFEQPELRRYHVRNVDGRAGVMDVAVAGTPAAISLIAFARTLPPGVVLDHGVDPAGCTFVIAIPAAFAPPPPPPPPRPPGASTSNRNLFLGLGGGALVVAVAAGVIVMRDQDQPRPELRMHSYGSWSSGCHPTYSLYVSTRPDAKITVLGKHVETDYSGEARFELTQADLGDAREVVIEGDHKRGYGKESLAIEPPTETEPPLSKARFGGDSYRTPQGVVTIGGGDPQPLDTDPYSSTPPEPPSSPDQLVMAISTCNVAPQDTSADSVKVVVAADTATITIDLGEKLLRIPGVEDPSSLEVPVAFTTLDGEAVTLTLTLDTSLSTADNGAFQRLANVATQPRLDAPAPTDVATPRPIAILWDGRLDRKLLGTAAPLDTPYVAVITSADKKAGSCGPYNAYYGAYGGSYTDRFRTDVDVKLYEARSGALVSKNYFKGKKPSCPYSVTTYNGVLDTISGDVPSTAVFAWLRKQQG